ncbi:hypothetical protein D3C79_833200 [compost metagenome]
MQLGTQLLGGVDQRSGAVEVGHGRELHGCKVQAGTVEAHRTGGDDDVAHVQVWLNGASGADAQEGIDTQLGQLFYRDGGGRAADTGGADDHGLAVHLAAPGSELTMAGQVHRVVQQLCDALHALGVTGNDRQGGALQIRFLQTQVKYIRHSGLLVASRRLAAERS